MIENTNNQEREIEQRAMKTPEQYLRAEFGEGWGTVLAENYPNSTQRPGIYRAIEKILADQRSIDLEELEAKIDEALKEAHADNKMLTESAEKQSAKYEAELEALRKSQASLLEVAERMAKQLADMEISSKDDIAALEAFKLLKQQNK